MIAVLFICDLYLPIFLYFCNNQQYRKAGGVFISMYMCVHVVSEEGLREMRIIRNEEGFVSYVIGGLVHQPTGGHLHFQARHGPY